jgi:hypothetical protein
MEINQNAISPSEDPPAARRNIVNITADKIDLKYFFICNKFIKFENKNRKYITKQISNIECS